MQLGFGIEVLSGKYRMRGLPPTGSLSSSLPRRHEALSDPEYSQF
jgi:hypothetical protein